jgi:hypothetical protein
MKPTSSPCEGTDYVDPELFTNPQTAPHLGNESINIQLTI